MTVTPSIRTYEAGCHCGAVRLRVTLRGERASLREALDCDCSICAKNGFLHFIVRADEFELLSGQQALTEYRFNTGVARHLFCSICGIAPFYVPRSHPDGFSVNARCLDGDGAAGLDVRRFAGSDWETNVASIQGPPTEA